MPKSPKAGTIVLLVILSGFLLGVLNLFLLRFEVGDSYPAYSSLRADPLGTKVLYESLENLEGMKVLRNYRRLSKLAQQDSATVFLFGAPGFLMNALSEEDARDFEAFVLDGGRLVLLLYPLKGLRPAREKDRDAAERETAGGNGQEKENAGNRPKKKQGDHSGADDEMRGRWVALSERWKIGMSRDEVSASSGRTVTAVPADGHGFRRPVSWHSWLWFKQAGAGWRTVYERDGKPVLIERTLGKGTIVLASDSYFVSNEAMLKERRPELLAWLVGGNGTVIFDETHLGIHEMPGVATLGRKYRLHGLFAGFLLLTMLFVWKNSVSLVPPRDDRRDRKDGARTGRDNLSGLADLLRRSIPRGNILAVCVEEWKKANRGAAAGYLEAIESVMDGEKRRPARERDPVRAYRAIHKLLSERKRTP